MTQVQRAEMEALGTSCWDWSPAEIALDRQLAFNIMQTPKRASSLCAGSQASPDCTPGMQGQEKEKRRTPAWTDRILWRAPPSLRQVTHPCTFLHPYPCTAAC